MASQKVAEMRLAQEALEEAKDAPGFEACLSIEERRSLEKLSVEMGVNRRIMLSLLGRSLEELVAADGKMPPQQVATAIYTMLKSVDSYGKHLDDMKGLVESAQTRLLNAAQTMIDRGLVE